MGTDPELDGFVVRARSLAAAPSPASLRGLIPTALRCDARHSRCRRAPLRCADVALSFAAVQRAYVKELEMLKAELEQILSAVRPSRALIGVHLRRC